MSKNVANCSIVNRKAILAHGQPLRHDVNLDCVVQLGSDLHSNGLGPVSHTRRVIMRIGIDASNIRGGGGLTHLTQLLASASPQDQNVSKITVWGCDTTVDALPRRNWLDAQAVPELGGGLLRRTAWQRLRLPVLAAQNCDVLFVPGGHVVSRFSPVVVMCQNMLPFEKQERRRYGYSLIGVRLSILRRAHAKSFREANGVIFLSEYARSNVEKEVGKLCLNTVVIPHGVSELFNRPIEPCNAHVTYSLDRPFRWLYVSIIDEYKHQWNVVEAVATLRSAGWPVALELVGPSYPPALRRLQRTLERLDPDRTFVHYLGPVPYEKLPGHYHDADGFVFASSCENMPNILVEAMASGLPICSSNRGPMPEILRDGGIYFDPEQPAEIADALHTVITEPATRDQCMRNAADIATRFSWERCANDTFGFIRHTYEEYLSETSRGDTAQVAAI